MKHVSSLDEFVRVNDKDLTRIVYTLFPKHKWKYFDMEDVKQDIYMRFSKNYTIEKYSPDHNTKFSTYVFRCVNNHILSYYSRDWSREKVVANSYSMETPIGYDDRTHTSEYFLSSVDEESFVQLKIELSEIHSLLKKYDHSAPGRTIHFSKLLEKLCAGYSDMDISNELGMTCAGVGAQKRSLVKLIKKCRDGSILWKTRENEETNDRKRKRRPTSRTRHVNSVSEKQPMLERNCVHEDHENQSTPS